MSDKQKLLNAVSELPDDISIQDILEALNLMFDINSRIENFDETKALTTEQVLEELQKYDNKMG